MCWGESLTSVCCGVLRDRCIRSHAGNLHMYGMSGEQRRSINTNTTAWLKLRGAAFLQLSPWAERSPQVNKKKKKWEGKCAIELFLSSLTHISDPESLWSMRLNLPWNLPWAKVLLLAHSLSLAPDVKCMRFFHYVSQKVQEANDAREK